MLRRCRDLPRIFQRQVGKQQLSRELAVRPTLGPEPAVQALGRVLKGGENIFLSPGQHIRHHLGSARCIQTLECKGCEHLIFVAAYAHVAFWAVHWPDKRRHPWPSVAVGVTIPGQEIKPLGEKVDCLVLESWRKSGIAL